MLFAREHAPLVIKDDIILSSIRSQETVISKLVNPTIIPDELLKVVTPIIFIRHPARTIPAWLREANSTNAVYTVDDDDLTLWTSARWSRMIFDYLRSTSPGSRPGSARRQRHRADSVLSSPSQDLPIIATRPIVIDAADVVHNTHAILATLCRLLGLDVEAMQDTWGFGQKFQRACESVAKTVSENLMKAFSDRLRSSDQHNVRYPSCLTTHMPSSLTSSPRKQKSPNTTSPSTSNKKPGQKNSAPKQLQPCDGKLKKKCLITTISRISSFAYDLP